MCTRAQTVGSYPAQHVCSRGANRQHEQDREAGRCETYLKQRDRVGPTQDGTCRLRSHLRAKHRRQFEILAVRFLRVPPLMQSVRAGVMEWVLEQGQGMRSWGQQHVVHGRARRTVE